MEEIKTGSIYGILCPTTNRVVYVGQTKGALSKRLKKHWDESRNKNLKLPLYRWLRKFKKPPVIISLEKNVPYENLNKREVFHIQAHYGQLLNGMHNCPIRFNSFNPFKPKSTNENGITIYRTK